MKLAPSHGKRLSTALVLSMMTLLAGCASSTPQLIRAELPAPPEKFGKPVAVPKPKAGQSLKVLALETRAAVLQANQRLESDREFYDDVLKGFSQDGE